MLKIMYLRPQATQPFHCFGLKALVLLVTMVVVLQIKEVATSTLGTAEIAVMPEFDVYPNPADLETECSSFLRAYKKQT